MKRKTSFVTVLCLLVFSMITILSACDGAGIATNSKATYYAYNNGVKDPDDWIQIDKTTWSDNEGLTRKVETEDSVIYCLVTLFGEESWYYKGTVKDGVFTFTQDDTVYYDYYSNSCTVQNKNSDGYRK